MNINHTYEQQDSIFRIENKEIFSLHLEALDVVKHTY